MKHKKIENIKKHLKEDMKTFDKEKADDEKLLRSLDASNGKKRKSKSKKKVERVMHEWKEGKLHSGSKHGPLVKSQEQAIAIALQESRKKKKK